MAGFPNIQPLKDLNGGSMRVLSCKRIVDKKERKIVHSNNVGTLYGLGEC